MGGVSGGALSIASELFDAIHGDTKPTVASKRSAKRPAHSAAQRERGAVKGTAARATGRTEGGIFESPLTTQSAPSAQALAPSACQPTVRPISSSQDTYASASTTSITSITSSAASSTASTASTRPPSPAKPTLGAALATVGGASAAGGRPRLTSGFERKEWTAAEDEIIREAVETVGPKWRKIAARLPGRSDDAVRNRWNRLHEEPALLAGGALSLLDQESPLFAEGVEALGGDVGFGHGDGFDAEGEGGSFEGGARKRRRAGAEGEADADAIIAPMISAEGLFLAPSLTKSVSIRPPAHPAAAGGRKPSGGRRAPTGMSSAARAAAGLPAPTRIIWTQDEDRVILRFVKENGHNWNLLSKELRLRTPHAIRNRYHRLQSMALDDAGSSDLLGEAAETLLDPSILHGP